jgi:hypothetical protein
MQEPEQPVNPTEVLPPVESLQFRRAEHAPDPAVGPACAACKQPTGRQYFQANGVTLCERCSAALRSTQQNVPPKTLLKAFLYGLGAAIAGSILYATVAIVTGLELALISILIGYMVGRAIRYASPGGRPLQIMAVVLTYLSISTSYVPVAIYHVVKKNPALVEAVRPTQPKPTGMLPATGSMTPLILVLLKLAVAAPFMTVNGTGGFLTLLILFFGLQRAWRLTARPDITISGPFQTQAAA